MAKFVSLGCAGLALVLLSACDHPLPGVARCCLGAGPANLDAPIPPDDGLRMATLPNGLRYYVRYVNTSSERTELRLIVNAGSVLEEDDQRGLAHAIEHLAIRGTRPFPQRAAEAYLRGIGMRDGEGINGTTYADETEYRISIPVDRAGALDTSLAILSGIAQSANLDGDDARTESGVIMEEWRSGRDAIQRIADARYSFLLSGTPYAARPPIGDTAVLRRFDARAMRRYYEKWYRPDLMAVIVVGRVDADEAERLIKSHFGGLPHPPGPPPAMTRVSPPPARELRATVVVDPEATDTRVALWFPRPPSHFAVRADYRESLVRWLWLEILQARLDDASLAPGSPLISASTETHRLARPVLSYLVSATTSHAKGGEGLEVITAEAERLAREGPTESELRDRSMSILGGAHSRQEAGEEPEDLAGEFEDHFLTGNAPITRAAAYEMTRDLLGTIEAEDVAAFGRTLAIGPGAVAIVAATSDDPIGGSSPADVVAHVVAGQKRQVVGTLDLTEPTLGEVTPNAGTVVAEGRNTASSSFIWRLSNGMRVLLRPSSATFDEIEFRLVAPGGASLAGDDEYPSAYLADAIIGETGVGGMSGAQLTRWLQTNSISLKPTMSDGEIALEGSSSPDDLEDFFKLVHLYLTKPRHDTVAFRRYRERAKSWAANRSRDPHDVFSDTLAALMAGRHPRSYRKSVAFMEAMRLDAALDFWRARAANASGMTVAIAGDFSLDDVRPLVERYLASLPAGKPETERDVGRRFPRGKVIREIRSGISEGARTSIAFSGPFMVTNEATDAISAVTDVVELALGNRIRETLGGTYGVDATYYTRIAPPANYIVTVDFETAADRLESLTAAALSELERLRTHGPTESEFAAIRAARARDYDGELKRNSYWTSELTAHMRLGWPLAAISEHPLRAGAMTLAELREACAAYIRTGEYVQVTMRPIRPN